MKKKRVIVAPIVLALVLIGLLSPGAMAQGGAEEVQYELKWPATTDTALDYSTITSVIADYFKYYYQSLEQLAVVPDLVNCIADTDDTHLYLRVLQYNIDWRKEIGSSISGIADSQLESIEIKHAEVSSAGQIDVRAYVKASFRYVADESRTMTNAGYLWEIGLDSVDGALKIVSLNSEASDYAWPKGLVAENLREAAEVGSTLYTPKNAADDAYEEMHAWMVQSNRSSLASKIDLAEGDRPQASSTLTAQSVGVSYSASAAALYGWLMGNTHDPGIFWNMEDVPGGGGDCTNFVSQCLWVGYGGPNGNDWTTAAGKAACRLLAWQNFRQIGSSDPTPWWGASKYNTTPRLASGHWMRVDELYSHVQTTSKGPRGTHHNSGRTYYHPDGSALAVVPGNVLQLDQTGVAPYFHSVMVVGSSTTLGNPANIYVGQHSGDYGWRQLLDVINTNGADYVRMLRMLTGSFNS